MILFLINYDDAHDAKFLFSWIWNSKLFMCALTFSTRRMFNIFLKRRSQKIVRKMRWQGIHWSVRLKFIIKKFNKFLKVPKCWNFYSKIPRQSPLKYILWRTTLCAMLLLFQHDELMTIPQTIIKTIFLCSSSYFFCFRQRDLSISRCCKRTNINMWDDIRVSDGGCGEEWAIKVTH